MANVKIVDMVFPYSLGKLMPGASYASASIPLTTNVTPTKIDYAGATVKDTMFNGVFIQAHPDNAGPIYVCNTAATPDVTTWTNVIGIVQPGEWFPRTKEWANNRDLGNIYIGSATSATDFAIASFEPC